jgi:G3E family GTPase
MTTTRTTTTEEETKTKKKEKVPVTIVTGVLGAGKTTFIRNVLLLLSGRRRGGGGERAEKKKEKIAILVNEFGSLGIDGAVLEAARAEKKKNKSNNIHSNENVSKKEEEEEDDDDIYVKEIPGGCVCCAASGSVPFLVAIKHVLQKVKPDRLVIEPSGLAHPSGLYDLFTKNEHLKDHVDLRGMVCIVDARVVVRSSFGKEEEEEEAKRVRESEMFRNQVSMSEVLVGSKLDLCAGETETEGKEEKENFARRKFREWAASLYPEKRVVKFAMDLLDENAETSPFDAIDREATSSLRDSHAASKSSVETGGTGGGSVTRPFQLLALKPPVEPGAKPLVSAHDTKEYASRGFLFHPDDIFRRDKLLEFFQSRCAPRPTKNKDEENEIFRIVRAKAVVRVSDKTWVIPAFEECSKGEESELMKVSLEEVAYRKDSRFEVIASKEYPPAAGSAPSSFASSSSPETKAAEKEFWDAVETQILLCRRHRR